MSIYERADWVMVGAGAALLGFYTHSWMVFCGVFLLGQGVRGRYSE